MLGLSLLWAATRGPGTPPATPIFVDLFNRADASTLGAPWTVQQGGWAIASNKAKASTAGNGDAVRTSAGAANKDIVVPLTLVSEVGIMPRCADQFDFVLVDLVASTGTIRAWINNNGTFQLLNSSAGGLFTSGQTMTVRVTVVGNAYTVYIDGTQRHTFTTSHVATSQNIGLWTFADNSSVFDSITVYAP